MGSTGRRVWYRHPDGYAIDSDDVAETATRWVKPGPISALCGMGAHLSELPARPAGTWLTRHKRKMLGKFGIQRRDRIAGPQGSCYVVQVGVRACQGVFLTAMVIRYTNFGNFGDDWEDDPAYTPPPAPKRIPQPPRATTPVAPPPKPVGPSSSFVSIEVDGGLLPSRFQFASNWNYQVSAHEVGRELLKAYQGGIARHLARLRESADGDLPPDYPHAHFLSGRQQSIMLLETNSWDEYTQRQDELFGVGQYRVHGPATMNDEPVMIISGNRQAIRSIRVWSQWWGCADPYALEAEVLACVHQIRGIMPRFHAQRDWSQYTDEKLSEMRRQHRRDLLELLVRGYRND